MARVASLLILAGVVALVGPPEVAAEERRRLTVSVAASIGDVMTEVVRRFETTSGLRVTLNIGSSSALARQIAEGAPADLFISADELQMDVVEKAGRVVPGSRVTLLSNQLAVVASPEGAAVVRSPQALADPAVRRIAMGNPASVPAGVYGRQWLERLQLWSTVQAKVVPLSNVRAALAAVREGRAQAAIVYVTDARAAPELTLAYLVPIEEAPSITYPAALVRGSREAEAKQLMDYLRSADARAAFARAGFGVMPQ